MNISRMWAMTQIIVQGHILNWFWRDRKHRRAVRSAVIERVIPKYFERYLPAAAAVKERKVVNNDKNDKIFRCGCRAKKMHQSWSRRVFAVSDGIVNKN